MYKLLICLCVIALASCTVNRTTTISTNEFVQTNYNHSCYNEDHTFTEIIMCLQKQDDAEKSQNNITNELILKTGSK